MSLSNAGSTVSNAFVTQYGKKRKPKTNKQIVRYVNKKFKTKK